MRLLFPHALFALAVTTAASSAPAQTAPTVSLSPAQQEKLEKVQRRLLASSPTSPGRAVARVADTCGAPIPIELDPSMVALDDPAKSAEDSRIDSTCREVADALVATCDSNSDAASAVKEIVRANVKRGVCRMTKNPAEVPHKNGKGIKWTLEGGALVYTCLAPCGQSAFDEGRDFLRENARSPSGLSIAGQLIKAEMLKSLGEGNSLRSRLASECGVGALTVSVDDKLAEQFSHHLGHAPEAACSAGLQALYNLCGDQGGGQPYDAKIRALAKKHFKGISCVFSDQESIAIKPGGILELGHNRFSTRPKWKGKNPTSIYEYYQSWLKENAGQFGR